MITGEVDTLVRAMLWGMILAFEYDSIRILRRVVRHYHVWSMSIEDILFWINVGFTVFAVTFDVNDGIVRGFLIGGFIIGALIFKYSLSHLYVRYISRVIIFILKLLKKAFGMIKMLLCSIENKGKKLSARRGSHFPSENKENL